jgi:hypothetical protein
MCLCVRVYVRARSRARAREPEVGIITGILSLLTYFRHLLTLFPLYRSLLCASGETDLYFGTSHFFILL